MVKLAFLQQDHSITYCNFSLFISHDLLLNQ
jgi:hypothetical protein